MFLNSSKCFWVGWSRSKPQKYNPGGFKLIFGTIFDHCLLFLCFVLVKTFNKAECGGGIFSSKSILTLESGGGVKMAKKFAFDVIYGWSHVAIALLGYRNPPSLSDKRSENINQFTNMTRSLLLASQHQKLSKHACAISCSSNVNNQSWISNLQFFFCILFSFYRCKLDWGFSIIDKQFYWQSFVHFDDYEKLLPRRKNKQKNDRFRIQEWLTR